MQKSAKRTAQKILLAILLCCNCKCFQKWPHLGFDKIWAGEWMLQQLTLSQPCKRNLKRVTAHGKFCWCSNFCPKTVVNFRGKHNQILIVMHKKWFIQCTTLCSTYAHFVPIFSNLKNVLPFCGISSHTHRAMFKLGGKKLFVLCLLVKNMSAVYSADR